MNVKVKGVTLGSIAAASYGLNPLFALPLYADGMKADSILLYRYVFAIIMMGTAMLIQRRSFRLRRRQLFSVALMGIVFSASSLLLFLSYQYMAAGVASTILFAYPLLVAVIMWLVFKERASLLTWSCIVMAFVGISLLYKGDGGASLSTIGIVLVLLSALSYAIYIVGVNRSVLKKMDSETLTFYALLFGSLIYVVRLIGIDAETATFTFALQTPNNPWMWVNLVCLALFPTIISLVTMNLSIHYIGSTSAAVLGALEPITALVIGVLIFHEALTPRIVVGVLMVLTAVTLLVAGKKLQALIHFKHLPNNRHQHPIHRKHIMKHHWFVLLLCVAFTLSSTSASAQRRARNYRENVPTDSIRLSDPFILADSATHTYYMTGTGGLLWTSRNLQTWDGPRHVIEVDTSSWMGHHPQVWAAELHHYKGKYYYFGTFTNNAIGIDTVAGRPIPRRACHILVSDKPDGPYRPMRDPVYLPAFKPTLDATLWIDTDGHPYMVYCHEWLQNGNGTVEKIRLTDDLSGSIGWSQVMFRASDSPWSRNDDGTGPNVVTDGPWLFRTQTGRLGCLWTSWVGKVYTMGVAYSKSGTLDGPWVQEEKPITPPNYGHGMMFHDWRGRLLLVLHSHDDTHGYYLRKPHYFLMDDEGDSLKPIANFIP